MKSSESDGHRDQAAKSSRIPDLTFVSPERRALVRSRIDAIESYLALPSAKTRDAIKSARDLGINVSSFYRLVRSWRAHGDARRLAGSGAKSKPFAKRVFGDEAFIAEAISLLPPAGSVEQDMEAIAALAADRDIDIRSLSALRKEVRRLRPEYDRTSVPGDLVIARTALEMPVQFETGIAMPVAIVVADTKTSLILGIRLREETGGPTDFADAFLYALGLGNLIAGSDGASSLTFGGVASEDHVVLRKAFAAAGLEAAGEINRGRLAANEWISRRVKSLNLKSRPRLAHQSGVKRRMKLNSDLDQPVTLARAQEVLNSRVKVALHGSSATVAVDETKVIAELLGLIEQGSPL